MEALIIPAAVSGAVGSILTEVFKQSAFFSKNAIAKSITAIVLTTAVALGYSYAVDGTPFTPQLVILSLISSLVAYRTIVEPVTETV